LLILFHLHCTVDQRQKLSDVNGLNGSLRWNRYDFANAGSAENHMASAVTWSSPANAIFVRNRLQLFDVPAGLVFAPLLEGFTAC
jgi:outer membrane receptor for monomeric catechols